MEANLASHVQSEEMNDLYSQSKPASREHQGKRGGAETNGNAQQTANGNHKYVVRHSKDG
jgi:hypothetical protein